MIKNPLLLIVLLLAIGGSIWYLQSRFSHPAQTVPGEKQEIVVDPSGIVATCEAAGNCTSTSAQSSSTSAVQRVANIEKKNGIYPRAIELAGISGYLNTRDGFKLADVVGKKVVLVDFWTYSCINCQRTQPYLNAWYSKYKDAGLEIVGVHTPEFEFEKDKGNLAQAIEKFGIKYPVVQDNDYATWNGYGNRYWPHKYLIDIDGYIVYDHIGEGGYAESEEKIQALLKERAGALGDLVNVKEDIAHPTGVVTSDDSQPKSPETYFGAARNELFGNGTPGAALDKSFSAPDASSVAASKFYLSGAWHIENEFARTSAAGAKVIYKYKAKNVYLVAASDAPVKITVMRDGTPVGTFAGDDVKEGSATIQTSRLYNLIKETDYGTHTLELIVDKPGVRFYTFTFG